MDWLSDNNKNFACFLVSVDKMENLDDVKEFLRNEELKYSELEEGITYLLCPSESCDLFWSEKRPCPCEYECPYVESLKKILYIEDAKDLIVLDGDYSSFRSIDFESKSGGTGTYFRNSGKHRIIYHMPVDDR